MGLSHGNYMEKDITIIKMSTALVLASFIFLISCSARNVEEVPHSEVTKKNSLLTVLSACYPCFDSLQKITINVDKIFDVVYSNVIIKDKLQDRDCCLLFWFLLKSNDESLNESMGEYVFKSLKTNRPKQKKVSESINQFSKKMRDTLHVRLISLMSIDIEAYSDVNQFKFDFPFLSDSTSISIVTELIGRD